MPRTARASIGGIYYHALNSGNAWQDVFRDYDDHARMGLEFTLDPADADERRQSRMSPFPPASRERVRQLEKLALKKLKGEFLRRFRKVPFLPKTSEKPWAQLEAH
jgi:hypothetical protein